MEVLRASTNSSRTAPLSQKAPKSRLTTPAKTATKAYSRRPKISSPIGPVKNSRGPDFTRSETLIVVDGIKDCSPNESFPKDKEIPTAIMTTRRISASFQAEGPLMSSPTVARSELTTTGQVANTAKKDKPLPKTPGSRLRLPTSSTLGNLPRLEARLQDENVPPRSSDNTSVGLASAPKSQLPKSRTMNVLHDLKTTISRPSLTARSVNSDTFNSISSRKTSDSSASSFFLKSSSRLRLPRTSEVSLAGSSRSSSLELLPGQIGTAQPSAYWSGRFVALHDRFAAESLVSDSQYSLITTPVNLPSQKVSSLSRQPKKSATYRPTHLSHSTTTSVLTSVSYNPPLISSESEDEARCRRVFLHLDGLCTTAEARRSLHDWQQSYARHKGQPGLLPQGGCMEGKGLISRFFGVGRKSDRRSMSTALKETSNLRSGGKKVSIGNAARTRGTRVSIN